MCTWFQWISQLHLPTAAIKFDLTWDKALFFRSLKTMNACVRLQAIFLRYEIIFFESYILRQYAVMITMDSNLCVQMWGLTNTTKSFTFIWVDSEIFIRSNAEPIFSVIVSKFSCLKVIWFYRIKFNFVPNS